MDVPSSRQTAKPQQAPKCSTEVPKQPYAAPELWEWGTLAELTGNVGYLGNTDGGRFPYGFRTR